ncbi:hypothetical protein Y1Q_0023073 [Alligator mississippiensis]|uniref:Uncharacterized protein n=1 Tax=Alligator mississippiensis TaxID=8496 RepID=A0A151NK42_ALLMI|nr:hypothetical protein Y1Q_0023073 [Alligator mississippiensis]
MCRGATETTGASLVVLLFRHPCLQNPNWRQGTQTALGRPAGRLTRKRASKSLRRSNNGRANDRPNSSAFGMVVTCYRARHNNLSESEWKGPSQLPQVLQPIQRALSALWRRRWSSVLGCAIYQVSVMLILNYFCTAWCQND